MLRLRVAFGSGGVSPRRLDGKESIAMIIIHCLCLVYFLRLSLSVFVLHVSLFMLVVVLLRSSLLLFFLCLFISFPLSFGFASSLASLALVGISVQRNEHVGAVPSRGVQECELSLFECRLATSGSLVYASRALAEEEVCLLV